jgi:hypothetical protein
MRELIEKKSADAGEQLKGDEALASEVETDLKKLKVRRVSRAHDEVYIDAGNDEASITFNAKKKTAGVRIVLYRDVPATGKAITDLLKKHGVNF